MASTITDTHGQENRECIGRGIANTVCGLFGNISDDPRNHVATDRLAEEKKSLLGQQFGT